MAGSSSIQGIDHLGRPSTRVNPTSTGASSHGLFGMRYRVEAEGGQLVIDTAPGSGTRIGASLPCRERTEAIPADALA